MMITFNPSDKSADITLSNGNLDATMTTTGAWKSVRATDYYSSGKLYFEVSLLSSLEAIIGVTDSVLDVDVTFPGGTSGSWGMRTNTGKKWHNVSNADYSTICASNDVIGVAVDFTAGKIWWSINNVWQAGGDPANGTNPAYTGVSGNLYPAVGFATSGNAAELSTAASQCTYAPPTGFSYLTIVLSGTLKEKESDASGAAYDYAIIKRSDGTLLAAGTAAADGTYSEETPDDTTEYDVVGLDNGGTYNPKIIEGVTGV